MFEPIDLEELRLIKFARPKIEDQGRSISTMAPSVALRIPTEPKSESQTRSLQDEVQQLVKQKGPFHSITEQRLLKDQALSLGNGIDTEILEEDNEDGTPAKETQQQTLERLYQARHQMILDLG